MIPNDLDQNENVPGQHRGDHCAAQAFARPEGGRAGCGANYSSAEAVNLDQIPKSPLDEKRARRMYPGPLYDGLRIYPQA